MQSVGITLRTQFARQILFCTGLVLSGHSIAQIADAQTQFTTPNAYDTGASVSSLSTSPTVEAPPQPSTRSIFVGTIAALIAQGLGNGIGNSLSAGIGGSITNWFTSKPTEPVTPAVRPALRTTKSNRSNGRTVEGQSDQLLHAGIAYEIHLIDQKGQSRAVDPARHAFYTGDRFKVFYRPTLPGRINVINLDPAGVQSRIDTVEVAAGQLASLGPYQFVNSKGKETLILVLEPCNSLMLASVTRSIAKVSQPVAQAATVPNMNIADCGAAAAYNMGSRTRSIRKMTQDGSTAFALDPLSKYEMQSGNVAARKVQIQLLHR